MADSISPILFDILENTSVKRKILTQLVPYTPKITELDIKNKVKPRYFAKYTTQKNGIVTEIEGGLYSRIIDNGIFYKTKIDWIIRGKIEDTILILPSGDNILVKGVISQNKALLSIAETELPGITYHLRNYLELYSGE